MECEDGGEMPGFDNLMLSNAWDKPKAGSQSTFTGA